MRPELRKPELFQPSRGTDGESAGQRWERAHPVTHSYVSYPVGTRTQVF